VNQYEPAAVERRNDPLGDAAGELELVQEASAIVDRGSLGERRVDAAVAVHERQHARRDLPSLAVLRRLRVPVGTLDEAEAPQGSVLPELAPHARVAGAAVHDPAQGIGRRIRRLLRAEAADRHARARTQLLRDQ